MRILVRDFQGNNRSVEIDENETLDSLKAIIEVEVFNIPISISFPFLIKCRWSNSMAKSKVMKLLDWKQLESFITVRLN